MYTFFKSPLPPQSITLTLLKQIYVFNCGHAKITTYLIHKRFKTLNYNFPIKASSTHRYKYYSLIKYNPKVVHTSQNHHSQRNKKIK